MGPDAMILVFWMLSFKPAFSLSSFTFMKRLFSSYSLPAIRVVSSAYLRLLIFLPSVLIPACASSSPAFLMMYSACKLNNQGDSIQPWRTPFPIWNQSVVPCPVLTVACWPAYRFLISIPKQAFFKKKVYLLIFWAVVGLHCCTGASSGCGERRPPFAAMAAISLQWPLLLCTDSWHTDVSSCGSSSPECWVHSSGTRV